MKNLPCSSRFGKWKLKSTALLDLDYRVLRQEDRHKVMELETHYKIIFVHYHRKSTKDAWEPRAPFSEETKFLPAAT